MAFFFGLGHVWMQCWLLVIGAAVGTIAQTPVISELSGYPGRGYSLPVTLGTSTPTQTLRVVLDTGSSNFAVATKSNAAISQYFDTSRSSTYKSLHKSVSVTYTEGYWRGTLATDNLTIGSLPSLKVQVVGIEESKDFFVAGADWQGILGLAYSSLAKPDSSVTPVFNSLVNDGAVSMDLFSMQLCGTVDKNRRLDISTGGKFVLNGLASSLYTGSLVYTPLRRFDYYEVTISEIAVDGQALGLNCVEYNNPRTIVDSGTTGLRLPTNVFNQVVSSARSYAMDRVGVSDIAQCIDNSAFWNNKDACCITPTSSRNLFSLLPNITLTFLSEDDANQAFKLTIPSQLYLQAVPTKDITFDCYKFFILPSQYGTVLGAVFMEGYYVIFDRLNKRVGFAVSTCEVRDPAFQKPSIQGPTAALNNASCLYVAPPASNNTKYIAMGVGISVAVLIIIIAFIAYVSLGGSGSGRRDRDVETPDYPVSDSPVPKDGDGIYRSTTGYGRLEDE